MKYCRLTSEKSDEEQRSEDICANVAVHNVSLSGIRFIYLLQAAVPTWW